MADKDRGRKLDLENLPGENDRDFEETRGKKHDPVDQIIANYKQQSRILNLTPNAALYKYDNPTGSQVTFSGYFSGEEIPEPHQVGLMFGSGRYYIILRRPKGDREEADAETHSFKLHARYDQLKREHEAEKARSNAALIPAGQQPASSQETFSIVKDILSLLLPVIKAAQQQQPQIIAQPPHDGGAKEAFNAYALMQEVLKNNLYDTAKTYKDIARKFSKLPEIESDIDTDEEDEPAPKEKGVMEKIIDMIEPFFNLIAQKGIAGKIAAATMKAAPAFNEVLKDKNLCKMIVDYFDKTRGRESADLALRNLGIDRRHFFSFPALPAAPAARPAGQAAQPAKAKAGKR